MIEPKDPFKRKGSIRLDVAGTYVLNWILIPLLRLKVELSQFILEVVVELFRLLSVSTVLFLSK